MHVISGQVCVMHWPCQAILRTGTPIKETDVLMSGMAAAPWEDFAKKHIDHVILGQGQAIFLPIGRMPVMTTLGDRNQPRASVTSTVLYAPVMAGPLLAGCSQKVPVVTYAAYNARLQLRTGTASWRNWAADFLEWLARFDPTAASDGDAAAASVEGEGIQPAR